MLASDSGTMNNNIISLPPLLRVLCKSLNILMPSCLFHETKPHQRGLLEGRVSSLVPLIWLWAPGPPRASPWRRLPSRGQPPYLARDMVDFTSAVLPLSLLVGQNDVEATKAAPVMNSAKADSSAATVPASASADDAEMKKVQEKCKRMQSEMSKLVDENRQLKVRYVNGQMDETFWSRRSLSQQPFWLVLVGRACCGDMNMIDHASVLFKRRSEWRWASVHDTRSLTFFKISKMEFRRH